MSFEIKLIMFRYFSKLSESKLRKLNLDKIESFKNMLKNESEVYKWEMAEEDQKGLLLKGMINNYWSKFQREMEDQFRRSPEDFLRKQIFLGTVSSPSFPLLNSENSTYLKTVNRRYPKNELKKLLLDDFIGKPYISSLRYKSTFVRLQHLYHITIFESLTGINNLSMNGTIVELGGGYGDMANLVYKNNPNSPTYIIIDLPIMCKIQYLYLHSIFPEYVHLVTSNKEKINESKINIVPLHLISTITNEADVFWATYSLTETNTNVVDLLMQKDFFHAKRYFIAYQSKNEDFKEGPMIVSGLESQFHLRKFTTNRENGNYLYL